jgi:hypothetical protein
MLAAIWFARRWERRHPAPSIRHELSGAQV